MMYLLKTSYDIVNTSLGQCYKVPVMELLLKNNTKILIEKEQAEKLKSILSKQKDGFIDINGEYIAVLYIAGILNYEDGYTLILKEKQKNEQCKLSSASLSKSGDR